MSSAFPSGKSGPLHDPSVSFYNDLDAFSRAELNLPLAVAASRWLALFDRYKKQANSGDSGGAIAMNQMAAALPGPKTWPLIERLLKSRPNRSRADMGCLCLLDTLQGHYAEAQREFAAIPSSKSTQAFPLNSFESSDWDVPHLLDKRTGNTQGIRAWMESLHAPSIAERSENGAPSYSVPEIVPILGIAESRKVLTRLLLKGAAELTFGSSYLPSPADSATQILARQIAEQNVGRLRFPQWTLADCWDGSKLFVGLIRQFPGSKMGISDSNPPIWSTYNGAATYYLANLCATGDFTEALAFAKAHKDEIGPEWRSEDFAGRWIDTPQFATYRATLRKLFFATDNTKILDLYLEVETAAGDVSSAEGCLRAALALPAKSVDKRQVESELVRMELSCGEYGATLPYLKHYLNSARISGGDEFETGNIQPELVIDVAKQVGDQALAAKAQGLALKGLGSNFFQWNMPDPGPLSEADAAKEQQVLVDRMSGALHSNARGSQPETEEPAEKLLDFYAKRKRYADAVKWLDEFPDWGIPDLAYVGDFGPDSPLLSAAISLYKVGQTSRASRILGFLLWHDPTRDEAYNLFIRFDRSHAKAVFEALGRAFPEKTRPTIYLAKLSMTGGAGEGEGVAELKAALEKDPADDEDWGRLTRFAATGMLASADGQGNSTGEKMALAAQYGVQADSFQRLGLDALAATTYRRELEIVPSDSRARLAMAEELRKIGNTTEAAAQRRLALDDAARLPDPSSCLPAMPYQTGNADLVKLVKRKVLSSRAFAKCGGVWAWLGMNLSGEAEREAAVRKALALTPESEAAWEAYEMGDGFELSPALEAAQLAQVTRTAVNEPNLWFPSFDLADYGKAWLAAETIVLQRPRFQFPVCDLPSSHRKLLAAANPDFLSTFQSMQQRIALAAPGVVLGMDRLVSEICSMTDSARNAQP